jgi:bifunctional DNA-binding transcriptional regulator/antitoxin component of YhaV-PrlF toxin-antitoxin module
MSVVDMGLAGVGLAPGDHVCAIYYGEQERDELLLPFLRAGLRAGDKCVAVVDADDPEVMVKRVGSDAGHDIDVDHCVASAQLELRASAATYLRDGKGFSTEDMVAFWLDNIGRAIASGAYTAGRGCGEMTWALRDAPGVEHLFGYESELNRICGLHPQVILCLYDLERFGGGIMVDLLKTHPKLLLGGMLLENPHYLTPDEFLASRA